MAIPALAQLLRAHCPRDGRFPLPVPGLHAARYSKTTTELIHSTPRPILCLVAQGAKTLFLGRQAFLYDAANLLVLSVHLPLAAQVTRATPAEPYLSLVLDLDPQHLATLVLKVFPHGVPSLPQDSRGVYLAPTNAHFTNAAVRLLELMSTPDEAALLAPLITDEILIRLLRSPIGPRLAQAGAADSHIHRISHAIAWLRTHFAQPIKIEHLAALAHMSLSSFHQHFKAVTSHSPLNFQKALRLQEARRLMLTQMMDASTASRHVGYLSPSQFSREYARFFGAAPTKDIARLLEHGLGAADVLR